MDQQEDIAWDKNFSSTETEIDKIYQILSDYRGLLEKQSEEREKLLQEVEKLSKEAANVQSLDQKVENLTSLLLEMKNQLGTLKQSEIPQKIDESVLKDRKNKKKDLDNEIKVLTELLKTKKEEVMEKDREISSLNEKMELLQNEKSQLVSKIEKLNEIIDSWKSQLDLLEKLALTDPRYKIIGTLKKHGGLTEIQLAFTLGSSIMQVKKFVAELKELGMISVDNMGRLVWKGEN